jgi:two-component system, cell cycle response regulator
MDSIAYRVLLVEDNPGDARLVQEFLREAEDETYCSVWVKNLAEASRLLNTEPFDLILLDLSLPDSHGLGTFQTVHAENSHLPVVVLTGLNDKTVARQAVHEGAQDYLIKDKLSSDMLLRSIGYALERNRIYAALKSLALMDPLTGLYNRRGFLTIAGQQLQLAQRTKKNLYIAFIDINQLKLINDTLGHQQGDQAIADAASVLRQTFRSSDVLARMGGDEFVALGIDAAPGTAEALRERLGKTLAHFCLTHPRPYRLSLSLGMASCDPAAGCTLDELLSRADATMYREKLNRKEEA